MAFPARKRKNQGGRVGIGVAALGGILVGSTLVWAAASQRLVLPFVQSATSSPLPSVSPDPGPFRVRFLSFERQEQLNSEEVDQSISSFLAGQGVEQKFTVETATLRFEVQVEEGLPSPVMAEVFMPISEDQSERFPLIVYGPGTTGLDDQCAPTREDQSMPTLGNYRNQMISQASQGYVVVMPNYEGLDNPDRIHYYFNSDIEARSLLGAAKATIDHAQQEKIPIQEDTLFFGGYSQGGHAAFAAADKAAQYIPRYTVSGVYGHGPTTNTMNLLRYNPNLSPYLVYAFAEFYEDFDETKVLLPNRLANLEEAKNLCVDEAFQFNTAQGSNTYTADFWQALQNDEVETQFPDIAQFLLANNSGLQYTDIPTFIVQGDADPIIPLDEQQEFADQLCENDVPVELRVYSGLDHFQSRQESFADTNAWIDATVNKEEVQTTCG